MNKKILSIILVIILSLSSVTFCFASGGDGSGGDNTELVSYGQFQNETYELRSGVQTMPAALKDIILTDTEFTASLSNDTLAYMTSGDIQQSFSTLSVGQVYIDFDTQLAVKITKLTATADGSTIEMTRAQLEEIFVDFEIPQQTVYLTEENFVDMNDPSVQYNVIEKTHTITLINKVIYDGDKGKATVNGTLTFVDPRVVGHANRTSYELGFISTNALTVKFFGNVHGKKDWKKEVGRFSIPTKIGNVNLILFVKGDMDGNLDFDFQFTQNVNIDAGVYGKCSWYVPITINPYNRTTTSFTTKVDINGQIVVRGGVVPAVSISIFGWDYAKIEAWGGLKVTGSILWNPPRVRLLGDAFVDIDGEVFGYDFNIWYWEKRVFDKIIYQ